MNDSQPKKILILDILDILQKETDENHRLTQKQIADVLKSNYSMDVDRKAVKRNLTELADFCDRAGFGYRVEHTEVPRGNNPDTDPICTDWYLSREITDAELRLLIDSILFSKYIPSSQCKDLIDKLKKLSSSHFSHKVKHVASLSEHSAVNRQLFYTIEVLDSAIEKGNKVQFYYGIYESRKTLSKKCGANGEPILYTVNPYQMAVTNGRYYLICNIEPHDDLSHFRVDRILEIRQMENQPAKPFRAIKRTENRLDLSDYVAEHLYMFSGKSERVTFQVPRRNLNEVLDFFDDADLRLTEEGGSITVSVHVNHNAMRHWAIQFCGIAEVLSPHSLRNEIRKALEDAAKKYR